MTYVPLSQHVPRTRIAANLTTAPRLRLVPAARPSLLWQPSALSADYGLSVARSRAAPALLRLATGFNHVGLFIALTYGTATVIDMLKRAWNGPPPPLPVEYVPGSTAAIAGYTSMGDFSYLEYGSGELKGYYAPGSDYNGRPLQNFGIGHSYSGNPGYGPETFHHDGRTYWSAVGITGVPSGAIGDPASAPKRLIERHVFRRTKWTGYADRLGSQNTLWDRDGRSAPWPPQVTREPGRWVPRLPLGQPLPLPLVQPGFPMSFPRPRRSPRLRRRRRLDRMPSVEIDLGTGSRPITVRPGREQPPPRNTSEVKMRGRGSIATLIFWAWEAAQDWTDWLGIVSRHSKAPARIRGGSPIEQLRWWRENPDQLMYVDWNEVAWSMLQWRIDESVGALQGRLMQGAGRNFGWPTHMDPSQASRTPYGQTIGQAVTSRLRDGVSFALDY